LQSLGGEGGSAKDVIGHAKQSHTYADFENCAEQLRIWVEDEENTTEK
jgi:hypothetical protein